MSQNEKEPQYSGPLVGFLVGAALAGVVGVLYYSGPPKGDSFREPQSIDECNPRLLVKRVQRGERLPASEVMYRYGDEETLKNYAQANTVPEELWINNVMGRGNRFDLKRYRRGLYGSEWIEDADHFGSEKFPWIAKLVIKKECRSPEKVAAMSGIAGNTRFQRWYRKKGYEMTLAQWRDHCFESDGRFRRRYFDLYSPDEQEESICEKVIGDYFDEKAISIFFDETTVRSWAIRDRDCFEKIEASNEFWIREMLTVEQVWQNSCAMEVNHRNRTRVFFMALSQVSVAQLSGLPKFSEHLKTITPPADAYNRITNELDRFAAQDFSLEFDQALERCKKGNRLEAFQSKLRFLAGELELLQSDQVGSALKKICR